MLFDEALLAAPDERYDGFDFPPTGRLTALDRLAKRVSTYFSVDDAVERNSHALASSCVVSAFPLQTKHGQPRNYIESTPNRPLAPRGRCRPSCHCCDRLCPLLPRLRRFLDASALFSDARQSRN